MLVWIYGGEVCAPTTTLVRLWSLADLWGLEGLCTAVVGEDQNWMFTTCSEIPCTGIHVQFLTSPSLYQNWNEQDWVLVICDCDADVINFKS